ncbi:hypothetical protein V6Z12_A13G070100 [Gossypium hirsutum]
MSGSSIVGLEQGPKELSVIVSIDGIYLNFSFLLHCVFIRVTNDCLRLDFCFSIMSNLSFLINVRIATMITPIRLFIRNNLIFFTSSVPLFRIKSLPSNWLPTGRSTLNTMLACSI